MQVSLYYTLHVAGVRVYHWLVALHNSNCGSPTMYGSPCVLRNFLVELLVNSEWCTCYQLSADIEFSTSVSWWEKFL